MYIGELCWQILREMRMRKLRSLLAIFGIAWGTLSVVLLLALGEGFYQAGQQNISSLVANSISVWPSVTTKPYQGMSPGRALHLKADTIMQLELKIKQIRAVSPLVQQNLPITWHGHDTVNNCVMGVNANYATMENFSIASIGRFLNPNDIKQKRYVVFVGNQLAKQIFTTKQAVNEKLIINGIPFLIIGVQQDKRTSSISFNWDAYCAFIPYTTALAIWGDMDLAGFKIVIDRNADYATMEAILYHYLGFNYQFDLNDKAALYLFNANEFLKFYHWFFLSIELFLGLCGFLTLSVGGISVANIMFLIVSERTKEIGLRMAVGAKPTDILSQFLVEAGLIVVVGGVVGFIFVVVLINLLQVLPLPDWLGTPVLAWKVTFGTIFILILVGLSAGFFPARRAAAMQPVIALNFS